MATGLYAPDGSYRVTLSDGAGGSGGGAITGNVASGATDAGAPVKIAGVYNTTKPTFTNAQRGDIQIGSRGSVIVQIGAADGTAAASVISPADTTAARTGLDVTNQNMHFNGTNWDRQRGDTTGTYVVPFKRIVSTTASVTRPSDTTPYTAGDVVGPTGGGEGLLTFASAARFVTFPGKIIGANLTKNGTSITNASFRLWLFESDPAGAFAADNLAFSMAFTDRGIFIGHITFTPGIVGGTTVAYEGTLGKTLGLPFIAGASVTSIFGVLEVTGAYTPISAEVFNIELYIEQG